MTRLRVAVGFLVPLIVAACGSGDDSSGPATVADDGSTTRTVLLAPGAGEDVPSALDDPDDPSFPPPLVDVDEIVSGGPPPDGIPAIDQPQFLDPAEVTFLDDREPVIAFELDGDARAYPLQILTWHEIVNDTVAGVPVAVTYCPLCNTAVVFDRRLGGRVLDFGTSGKLYQSALVMYDRQTESLWSHFTSQSLAGALAGEELATFPAAIVSWASWKSAHADGLVLSRDTGHGRDYGTNPYPGYDDVDRPPFLFDGKVDGRLAPKERIVGIGLDADPVAVRLDALAASGVLEVSVDGQPVVMFHLLGTASALEASSVAGGRDIGAVGVFDPVVDGRTLTFTRVGDGFVDDQTSSRWDIFDTAVAGPLAGRRLEPVEHVDTFWFAWAATRSTPASNRDGVETSTPTGRSGSLGAVEPVGRRLNTAGRHGGGARRCGDVGDLPGGGPRVPAWGHAGFGDPHRAGRRHLAERRQPRCGDRRRRPAVGQAGVEPSHPVRCVEPRLAGRPPSPQPRATPRATR